MTPTKLPNGKANGINMSLRWSEVVAFASFLLFIGPAIFYLGALSTRISILEEREANHEMEVGHPRAVERLITLEAQYSEILRRLDRLAVDNKKEGG